VEPGPYTSLNVREKSFEICILLLLEKAEKLINKINNKNIPLFKITIVILL